MRRYWALLAAIACVGAAWGCLAATATSASKLPARATRVAGGTASENAWVARILTHMTLPEKVGQLFEVDGYGSSARDRNPTMVKLNRRYYGVSTIAQLIRKYHVGGMIYFDWTNNYGPKASSGGPVNPAQVVRLSNGIQRVALSEPTPVPMVISTDQEEGEVLRIGPPATVFPGNMALGATRDAGLARRAALITGVELRAMGVNVDNAPVTDVNINPRNTADGIRSYGDRIGLVSRFGVAQVKGYQTRQATTGVGATSKHFPGFGDTSSNSDFSKTVSPQTLAQVKRMNFPSMSASIRAGVDRVMVTHILFPKITGDKFPSSMSRFWITRMLRGHLHYSGPVVTDALDAAAVQGFPPKEVALKAFGAGADELLEIAQYNPPTIDKAPANLVSAYNAMLHAVKTHKVSTRRLDQSVTRILRLKWELGLVRHPFTNPNRWRKVVGTRQHLRVANTAASRAITVVKNSAGLLPLAPNTHKNVLVTGLNTSTIAPDISARGLNATALNTGINPKAATILQATAAAQSSDLVVVTTFNAWSNPGQITLVNALLATGKPVVVQAAGTPYDIAYFPSVSTFVTSYDFQPGSLHAMVRALFGEFHPTAKLPVTITAPPPSKVVLYPFGYGLSY